MSVCDSVHGNRLITQGVPVNGCLRVLGSITGFPSLPITGMLWLYTRQCQDLDSIHLDIACKGKGAEVMI